jgi:hypothetical protein
LAQRFHTEGFEPLIDKTIIVRVYEARFQDVKERIFVAQGIPVVEQNSSLWPRSWTVSFHFKSTRCFAGSRTLESCNIREVLLTTHPLPSKISIPTHNNHFPTPLPPLSNQLTSAAPGLRHSTPKYPRFPIHTRPTC